MRPSVWLQRIGRFLFVPNALGPNPKRRAEIIGQLSKRASLSHEEWYQRFAAAKGIPLQFVGWFRDTCSKYFGYDLSAALPDDRLTEDLGLFTATWDDVDADIFEEYEGEYRCKRPHCEDVKTFGQFAERLWSHAQRGTV